MILKCIKVVAAAAFALVSLNVSGQDLLARQAPIDRKFILTGATSVYTLTVIPLLSLILSVLI